MTEDNLNAFDGMCLKRGTLSHADGSAVFSLHGSTIIAAVYGPTETRGAREELVDRAIIEVTYQPKIGTAVGCEGRVIEKFIGGVCESVILTKLHPQARFIISLQEISSDGCLLACAINATCAALLDACVPMRTTFSAVPCNVFDDGTVSLTGAKKPNKNSRISSTHTVVLDSKYHTILTNSSAGKLSLCDTDYEKVLGVCKTASESICKKLAVSFSGADEKN